MQEVSLATVFPTTFWFFKIGRKCIIEQNSEIRGDQIKGVGNTDFVIVHEFSFEFRKCLIIVRRNIFWQSSKNLSGSFNSNGLICGQKTVRITFCIFCKLVKHILASFSFIVFHLQKSCK